MPAALIGGDRCGPTELHTMRIAVIATPWTTVPPELYGGTERVVDQLARGFQKAGHDVVLFTTGDSTCPVERHFLLPVADTMRMGRILTELRHVLAAYDDPAVRNADVVHDHTTMGPFYAQRFGDLKVATTVHWTFSQELCDLYCRVAESVPIIAVSHAQQRSAPTVPFARVVHHGVDPDEYLLGAGDGGYCVFLGRMTDFKGAHRAVVAARLARIPIIVAGRQQLPSEVEYFESMVAPMLGDEARYIGEVAHDQKRALLAGATALLFPIRWNEPFGLVMIEALACGTPVIAFREGAAPEVIDDGNTGFLCDDEAEMAAALGRIRSIDRTTCRAAVEGYFSTGRMVRDHVEVFEMLLS
ncbi:MAG: glycosyltransferase family 4 protein [Acidimicrobiales bacterium]